MSSNYTMKALMLILLFYASAGISRLFAQSAEEQDYLPGNLILAFKAEKTEKEVMTIPAIILTGTLETRHLGQNLFFLIKVKPYLNLDSIILSLHTSGIEAYKDYVIPQAGIMTLTPNEFYGNNAPNISWTAVQKTTFNYWGSRNYDQNNGVVGAPFAVRNSMDSLLAFMPALYSNNVDDAEESVTFVHTEIPRMTHIECPPYDSANSRDQHGNLPVYATNNNLGATSHGSLTTGMGCAKWNNITPAYFGGMAGMTNNKPIIYQGITIHSEALNNGSASSSGTIKSLSWCLDYLKTHPAEKLVMSRSFGFINLTGWLNLSGGTTPYDTLRNQLISTQRFLCSNAASNNNVAFGPYAQADSCFISVGACELSGAKAYFSNFGANVDVFFPGYYVGGLSFGNDQGVDYWSGTSASAPGVAGAIVTLWNLMPNKAAREIKAMLKDTLNAATFTLQPDGTRKPVLNLWQILGNQIWPIKHYYRQPIDAHDTPVLHLASLVNDLINTQINRRFYLQTDTGWKEIAGGDLNIRKLASGTYLIKYRWVNSQTWDASGQQTESELIRSITIFHTMPQIDSLNYWCEQASTIKLKFWNRPQFNSLDTFKILYNGINVTNIFNFADSTITLPIPSSSDFLGVKFIVFKKGQPNIADTILNIMHKATINNPTINIVASQINILTGDTVNFSPNCINPGPNPRFYWYVNGQLVDSASTFSYTPADEDSVYCLFQRMDTCSIIRTVVSNYIVINVDAIPLPLNIISFTGTIIKSDAKLAAKIYCPQTSIQCIIQSSIDGIKFTEETGRFIPRNVGSYYILDTLLAKQFVESSMTKFYRLKIIDHDEVAHFSHVIKMNRHRSNNQLSIYPNPVCGQFWFDVPINFTSPKGLLINALGEITLSLKLENGVNAVNTKSISPGIYILMVVDEASGNRVSNKVFINQ